MKLTRHNGRSGKHGTYNPRHNDRRFDVENSEHIDAERARKNVYWDCYRGFTTHEFRENPEQPDFSFEEIERMYYYEHYGGHVEAQNARNEKTRHTERNRTVEDLLKNNKTCPEESIYQIGTMGESVPPDTLFSIVNEFYEEFERRFGSHIHILDWALHLDEGTPHIHERHVFDCENRYGELCPQQEKALEELGIPLPNPEKPKGRNNNRKQTFDAVCRTILFDIARRHGLHLDQEPSYGGRDYLEKQDYILMKQKEQLATQEQKLEELTLKIENAAGVILPGVGAFPDAMAALTDSGLTEAVLKAAKEKPFLGICLGMQMLFEESDEVRPCKGLGLLPGRIERIETSLKLPQIGWNALDILRPNAMTEGLENGSYVYFVHSFMAHPADENDLAAVTDYGTRVPAMVARGNLFGCQFHPEKSGEVGLAMLRNFAKLTEVGK